MVAEHTSFKLKLQILLAIPTAIPLLGVTSTFGNVVGNKTGSFKVPS